MRWIIRIGVAIVAAVLIAAGLLFMLPADRIGQIASEQLEKQTGRTLVLSGDFRPTIFPTLGASTGALSISNAEWSDTPQMITAEGAAFGVDLAALIGGNLRVKTLRLTNPVIHLEKAADGRVNWDLGSEGTETSAEGVGSASSSSPTDVSLENGIIENGTVIYSDAATGQRLAVTEINGTASLPAGDPSLTAMISAFVDGEAASIEVSLADRAKTLAGERSNVTFDIEGLGTKAAFSGALGLSGAFPTASGTTELSAEDLAALAKRLGVSLPPQMKGLKDLKLTGLVDFSDAGLSVNGDLGGTIDGSAIAGQINLAGEPGWMETQSFTIDADLRVDAVARLSWNGIVAPLADTLVNGTIDADVPDLRRALSLAQISVDLPQGALQSASVAGALNVSRDGTLRLRDGRYGFDANRLSGPVTVKTNGVPTIEAALRAGALDLKAFTADNSSSDSSTNEGGASSSGWSKDPIAISGLDAVNANVSLRADSVDLGPTQLGTTDIVIRLENGRMNVTLNRVGAFDGTISGTATVRGNNGLSFASDLRADGIQLEPLLGQLAGITRLTGSGQTRLKLTGNGTSLDAIMRSLTGTGSVDLGDGTIRGVDLAAMMRNLKSAFGGFEGATEFSSLTGTFQMDKGVLQNIDLNLVSPLFRAGGKGSVDVGGQAMNYVISPTSLAEGAEFTVPVTITGPWSNLSFRPDLEALADLILSGKLKDTLAGQEKLDQVRALLDDPGASVEGEVKERLEKKLFKELNLGTPTDTGNQQTDTASLNAQPDPEPQSIEDRIKIGLADKLRKELGLSSEPEPQPEPAPSPSPQTSATGSGTALALSTPGKRPRARPGSLNTAVNFSPQPATSTETVAEPAPEPDTRSTEEKIKDSLEDAAKNELKKLFKFD